jgi:integrase
VTFTARSIAALRPPDAGQRDVWDPSLPGFGIRVSYGGRRVWVVRYRINGRQRRFTIGKYPDLSLAKARKKGRTALSGVTTSGIDPAAQKFAGRTGERFAVLAAEYLEEHAKAPAADGKPRKKSWREDQRIIDAELLPAWKHRKVRELARRDIRCLVDQIAARPAPVMANRVLALVRKMLNFALEHDWIEANPAAKIPRLGAERARERVLSVEEIRKVWAAFETKSPLFQAFCKLRFLTAQRGGELRKMRWADLEFAGREGDSTRTGWWTIPAGDSKNRLSHRVPLANAAVQILDALRPLSGESTWVFPSPVHNQPILEVKKVIQDVQKDTGIEFRGHDLRRTAASQIASAGVSRLAIAKVLNHAEQGVTTVHDRHSYDPEKREALDMWARRLDAILAGKEDEPAKVIAIQQGRSKRRRGLPQDWETGGSR